MAIAKTYRQKRFNFISDEELFDVINDYENSKEYDNIDEDKDIHHIEYMIDECCVGDDRSGSQVYRLDFEEIDKEIEINKIKNKIKEENN